MKLTIRSENGEKVIDLKNNLQFNTIKGEQYVFSNGFTNYVLNFKDNQESVVLTFNVDGKSIKVDNRGNVLITGGFSTTVDFDPDPSNKYYLTAKGSLDIFVLKLDTSTVVNSPSLVNLA